MKPSSFMVVPHNMAATETRTTPTEQESLSWSVHLLRRSPRRLPQIGAILLGTMSLSLLLFHSLWLALPLTLALLFSLSEFVFPIRYTLTEKSAAAKHGLTLLEISWSDVRHAYLTDDGIKLSPLRTKNSRFEPLRGVYLRFSECNRETVIAAVQRLRLEAETHG